MKISMISRAMTATSDAARQINWTAGFLRLWLVLTLIWVGAWSIALEPHKEAPKAIQGASFEMKMPTGETLTFRQLQTEDGLISAKMQLSSYFDKNPDKMVEIQRAYADAPWFQFGARHTPDAVADAIANRVQIIGVASREKARGKILEWAELAILPPLSMLLLGIAFRWILRGFVSR